jgi:hypothetical protein
MTHVLGRERGAEDDDEQHINGVSDYSGEEEEVEVENEHIH